MRMSKIVRFCADMLYPAIVIFGLYVIMHGHITPGGGFQGGAVVATAAALVIVAYSYEEIQGMLSKFLLQIQESAGLVMFGWPRGHSLLCARHHRRIVRRALFCELLQPLGPHLLRAAVLQRRLRRFAMLLAPPC